MYMKKYKKKYKKYNLAFICSVVWHPVLTRFFIVLIQHNTSDNLPYEKVGNSDPVCIANEVPFLSVQNISSGKFDLTKIKYITQEEHQKSTLLFPISQGTPPTLQETYFVLQNTSCQGIPLKPLICSKLLALFHSTIYSSKIFTSLLVLTKPMRITYFSNIVFKSNLCYSIKKNFDLLYQRRDTQNDWIKFQQTPTLYLLKPSSISCSRTSYRQSFQRRRPHFDAKRYLAIYRGQ